MRTRGRQDLVENYLSVLVKAFIDAKLIESLIEIMKDTNRFLAVRATILLGEIMNLANRLVSPRRCHSNLVAKNNDILSFL